MDELAFIDNGRMHLRIPKEDLIDRWRKISFRYAGQAIPSKSVLSHCHEGNEHQIISSEFPLIIEQLKGIGAENIQDSPMRIEEIAVQILKGGKDVEII